MDLIIYAPVTCVACKHWRVDVGEGDYSEVTPGADFTMECLKKRWEYHRYLTESHYQNCITAACRVSQDGVVKLCPDFAPTEFYSKLVIRKDQ